MWSLKSVRNFVCAAVMGVGAFMNRRVKSARWSEPRLIFQTDLQ